MVGFVVWVGFILACPFISESSRTNVVLLENEKDHNAVVVSNAGGTVLLDKPYRSTTLVSSDVSPSAPVDEVNGTVLNRFASELAILPPMPESFLFYFENGSTELTEESKNQLSRLIDSIREHEPASLDLIGHTDSAGDEHENDRLGFERAGQVATYLRDNNISVERMNISSYGENDPLVPTKDGMSEPKNRRVEAVVR